MEIVEYSNIELSSGGRWGSSSNAYEIIHCIDVLVPSIQQVEKSTAQQVDVTLGVGARMKNVVKLPRLFVVDAKGTLISFTIKHAQEQILFQTSLGTTLAQILRADQSRGHVTALHAGNGEVVRVSKKGKVTVARRATMKNAKKNIVDFYESDLDDITVFVMEDAIELVNSGNALLSGAQEGNKLLRFDSKITVSLMVHLSSSSSSTLMMRTTHTEEPHMLLAFQDGALQLIPCNVQSDQTPMKALWQTNIFTGTTPIRLALLHEPQHTQKTVAVGFTPGNTILFMQINTLGTKECGQWSPTSPTSENRALTILRAMSRHGSLVAVYDDSSVYGLQVDTSQETVSVDIVYEFHLDFPIVDIVEVTIGKSLQLVVVSDTKVFGINVITKKKKMEIQKKVKNQSGNVSEYPTKRMIQRDLNDKVAEKSESNLQSMPITDKSPMELEERLKVLQTEIQLLESKSHNNHDISTPKSRINYQITPTSTYGVFRLTVAGDSHPLDQLVIHSTTTATEELRVRQVGQEWKQNSSSIVITPYNTNSSVELDIMAHSGPLWVLVITGDCAKEFILEIGCLMGWTYDEHSQHQTETETSSNDTSSSWVRCQCDPSQLTNVFNTLFANTSLHNLQSSILGALPAPEPHSLSYRFNHNSIGLHCILEVTQLSSSSNIVEVKLSTHDLHLLQRLKEQSQFVLGPKSDISIQVDPKSLIVCCSAMDRCVTLLRKGRRSSRFRECLPKSKREVFTKFRFLRETLSWNSEITLQELNDQFEGMLRWAASCTSVYNKYHGDPVDSAQLKERVSTYILEAVTTKLWIDYDGLTNLLGL